MTRQEIEAFRARILHTAKEVMTDRSNDYATDVDALRNINSCKFLGVEPGVGVLVRMQDKIARLSQLFQGKTLQSERAMDSVVDLINYSILLGAIIEQDKGNE